ncbi:MAG: hypothetical protein WCP97_01275 [bacterium]
MSTSRQIIPPDVHRLIAELKPIVSPESKSMDIIRIALVEMKKTWLVREEKVTINDPRHPYYAKTTPAEEKALELSFREIADGDYTDLNPDQDISELLND